MTVLLKYVIKTMFNSHSGFRISELGEIRNRSLNKHIPELIRIITPDSLRLVLHNVFQIVNDVFALYMSGDIDRLLTEDILSYLDNERSFVVWEAVVEGFNMLRIEGSKTHMTKNLYWEWEVRQRSFIISLDHSWSP